MGAAGLGSALASAKAIAGPDDPNAKEKTQKPELPQVPKRKLGKTGIEVPCLSLGGAVPFVETQIILRKAYQWGVTYWDTSSTYIGGNSEIGIGKFLLKNPQLRKELFIVTRAFGAKDMASVEKRLQASLKRMNTKYIDLYEIMDRTKDRAPGSHGLSDPAQLTDELKQWAQTAKKRKLIRFFGFSTHSNIAKCLAAAAKFDWIDAIMTSYNFRLMQDSKMQDAVDACHKAGVGLVAMKTQAKTIKTEEDRKLTLHFLQRGFTEEQAKIKAVLEDERFSSACVGMGNVAFLTSNATAVLDKTKLSHADMDALSEYAAATCSGYCAGCAHICDSALPDVPYVSEVMRYLMYYNSYGEQENARELFAQIPDGIRNKLLSTDYRFAEARCPQHLPIGKLVAEAVNKLA